MQDFDFWGCKILIFLKSDQIFPNLNHFCPIFAKISLNNQICPKSNQFYIPKKKMLRDTAASPAPMALHYMYIFTI